MRAVKAFTNLLSGATKPSDAWRRHVTIIGVFRSGTNLVRDILERSYRVRAAYNTYGWKHAPIPVRAHGSRITLKDWPLVVVSKDPYASLASLHKYSLTGTPYIAAARAFPDFLRQPIILRARYSPEASSLRFANPIDYWVAFYHSAFSFQKSVVAWHHLRHVDLLEDAQGALSAVGEMLRLQKRRAAYPLSIPDRVMAKSSEKKQTGYKKRAFDKDYYTGKRYLESYSADDIAFVERNLDQDLVARMGYSVCP